MHTAACRPSVGNGPEDSERHRVLLLCQRLLEGPNIFFHPRVLWDAQRPSDPGFQQSGNCVRVELVCKRVEKLRLVLEFPVAWRVRYCHDLFHCLHSYALH